jgi:5-oxoprolinase (ATP-hydrolysing) subunit C
MSLIVLEPGLDSRIVDLGRPRTRSLGVPVGGAADRRSLILGNALIGNAPDAAALEFALKGPRLRAEADLGCVLFGAPFDAFRGDQRIQVGHSFTLRAGEELRIGGTGRGARAYLCVCGGFKAPTILGSRSMLEPVVKGEILACEPSTVRSRSCFLSARSKYWIPQDHNEFWGDDVAYLSVLPGLQADWFDEKEFFWRWFTVTPASNRMGIRLHGEPLTLPTREMVSEPVCPGSVQVTNDGQCILLGVDGQTIGGYPKIAQVIERDLEEIGQLRPGQSVCFTKVSMDEAVQWDRAAEADLRMWTMRLQLSLDAFPAERRFASS